MTRKISGGVSGALGVGSLSLSSTTIIPATVNTDLQLEGTGTGIITTDDPVAILSTVPSTNIDSGALIVDGGLAIAGDLYIGGGFGGAGFNDVAVGSVTPAAGSFTTLTATGLTTLSESTEIIGNKTGVSGVVTYDFNEANTWVHTNPANNFVPNIVNLPTTNDRTFTITLIINQNTPGYYANGLQIGGVAQQINWDGGALPIPGEAGSIDTQVFTLVRTGSTWTVSSTFDTSNASYYRLGLRWYYDASVAASAPTGGNGTNWVNLGPGGGSVATAGSDFSYSTALGIGTVFGNTTRTGVNSAGIPINLSSFNKLKGTLEFWVYPTTYTGGNGLFVNRSDSTPNDNNWFWVGFWDSGNDGYFRVGAPSTTCCGNDNSGVQSGGIFPINTWHQVVFTWDFTLGRGASYSKWWKNGKPIKTRGVSDDVSSSNVSATGLLFNGHENATNSTFKGHCSIIRHYNLPLTPEQVQQNFNANRLRHGI